MMTNERSKTAAYFFLLGLQVFGAIVFILQELPEFRQVVLAPGKQLPEDIRSDLGIGRCFFRDTNCLLVQAIACPNSSTAPEPFAVSRFSFSGAPQFYFRQRFILSRRFQACSRTRP
jgi:hypothetical protein